MIRTILVSSTLLWISAAYGDTATGKRGMVASVHPIATQAGLAAFRAGGNAVDAAVATAIMLGVVDGHNSGLGGGCFVLIRRGNGELLAVDGRETAPAAATRDMFLRDGAADTSLSQTGPLASGVPGALAAYEQALAAAGKLALSPLLLKAAEVAEKGFAVDEVYAGNLQRTADRLRQFEGSREMLLKPDGSAYQAGEILRLPDLARTYRRLAEQGSDWFYRGEFAQRIDAWMQEHGGILRAEDLASYAALRRDPIVSTYRGFQIIGFPPPSSGGIHVAQILNILEAFDLPRYLRDDPPRAYHLIAEAMKLAFADRAHWLGDADFAPVPKGLVSKEYARRLTQRIDDNRAIRVPRYGLPRNWESDIYGKHTTHIATADDAGNWVAITATVNTSFGSKVVVPGTGIVLNNEMDDFSAQPGTPNAFGLVGAEANAVSPGKRPLSSMSPTIVLQDNQPILTLGAAGGPKIITQVVLTLIHFLDGEMSLADSLRQPRLHHQWKPDALFVEPTMQPSLVGALRQRGHDVQFLATAGVTQAIQQRSDGWFVGVADPRVSGQAAGR